MRVCVLGSGSKGNAVYIGAGPCHLLVDAGLSLRLLRERLAGMGIGPAEVTAVCLTHEHQDHTRSAFALHRRFGCPLYANAGTIEGLGVEAAGIPWNVFTTGSPFSVGEVRIEPFSVSHDALDPVGFSLTWQTFRVGVALDLGMVTRLTRERLAGSHALVVESNHDEHLLQQAPRPWSLKQRIRSRQGHLSNGETAALLEDVAGPQLRQVFLAHLSEECNSVGLALEAARKALAARGCGHTLVAAAPPGQPSEVWTG